MFKIIHFQLSLCSGIIDHYIIEEMNTLVHGLHFAIKNYNLTIQRKCAKSVFMGSHVYFGDI
jgi:hypothetical protein